MSLIDLTNGETLPCGNTQGSEQRLCQAEPGDCPAFAEPDGPFCPAHRAERDQAIAQRNRIKSMYRHEGAAEAGE